MHMAARALLFYLVLISMEVGARVNRNYSHFSDSPDQLQIEGTNSHREMSSPASDEVSHHRVGEDVPLSPRLEQTPDGMVNHLQHNDSSVKSDSPVLLDKSLSMSSQEPSQAGPQSPTDTNHTAMDGVESVEMDGKVAVDGRLEQFRSLFTRAELLVEPVLHIDAYILPRTDAHQSEYLSERDKRVQYLSGFSGSNAFVVVTGDHALIWTDGRYFIQAHEELRPGWTLMKEAVVDSVDPIDWLISNLTSGSVVGFDPYLFGLEEGRTMVDKLSSYDIQPLPMPKKNLVDVLWDVDEEQRRPPELRNMVIHLSAEESGEDSQSKIKRIRDRLTEKKCDSLVLTLLDDIAWLFNIRGSDVPYNPVVFAIAAVTVQNTFLFIDERKLSPELLQHLQHVNIFPYESATEFIEKYHAKCLKKFPETHRIWLPPTTNYALGSLIHDAKRHALEEPSPVQWMKCVKNEVELKGMRASHVRDSAAHVQFLLWLRRELELGHLVDEKRAAKQMDYYRSQLPLYVSPSFGTISASEENSAQPHYRGGQKPIHRATHYLVDSGGQYRDGTTDVTRTVCHAEPEALASEENQHFKRMFTLVLKGHIDTATVNFPSGISGMRLDVLARGALWQEGYDFGHGVGHGVGHFLYVHEAPIGISGKRLVSPDAGLAKGQVLTIEPGYYLEGHWGIRIENCYEIVNATSANGIKSGFNSFLTFAPLTYVPIQKNLIDKSLLEEKHVAWLNHYHNRCLELVGKYLQEQGMQEEYNYLAEACTPL